MGSCMDFLYLLETDMSIKITSCLDNPSDLVRLSSVSGSWHRFVITNVFCKQLCKRMFPQLSSVARVTDSGSQTQAPPDIGSSSEMEWESLKREHKVYAILARDVASSELCSCISTAISASTTDNPPQESISNTLEPRDRVANSDLGSYWSSKGHRDPASVETLVYNLVASLCVVTEINIQPFQAYFQNGSPIYSSKSVRFKMGHCVGDISTVVNQHCADDMFVWTYTSTEFPMAQENCLQTFKLPEPVLCIGGILQVELLGRVQRQAMDELFYTCITHVKVMGRNLSPTFNVQILEPCGNFLLQYCSEPVVNPIVSVENILHPEMVQQDIRRWEQVLNMLRADAIDRAYEWEEEEESDEEYII